MEATTQEIRETLKKLNEVSIDYINEILMEASKENKREREEEIC